VSIIYRKSVSDGAAMIHHSRSSSGQIFENANSKGSLSPQASASSVRSAGFGAHLRDGVDRRHFTQAQVDPLMVLSRRALAAVTWLIRYLRTAPANPRT
jgi:hypothetical protein